MIRLNNVNKYFNKRKANEIHAIDNTSLELGDKGLVTFLGNSGCGKTTLLNAIGGLDKVNSGDIFIDDKKITGVSAGKKDEIRNLNVGYIFQNFNLIDDDTVFENVALVLSMMGVKDKKVIEERVMYILEKVGIDKYKNRPAKMLSGGERQRVGIARAIVKNPKIIIADEPTGNLDSKNTIEIMNIIKAISREKLVILVTHERQIAQFYSDRILDIVDGKIVADRDNSHDEDLDYRLENKIYLKDLPFAEHFQDGNVKVDFYSDNEEPINVRVVVKNNNIYIETKENLQAGLETMEMVDDHYKMISKDIYEDYEFNYGNMIDDNFVPKYSSIFNLKTLIVEGYKKVFGYSIIKKLLLIGFIFASVFVIYSVSNAAGINHIEDKDFVSVNKNYLTISTPKLTPKTYNEYTSYEGIDYAFPGSASVNFQFDIDDYYQSSQASCFGWGSLSDVGMISEENLIAGKMPENKQEVVVDEMVITNLKGNYYPQQIGINSNSDFVGRTISFSTLDKFTIVGVVREGSPSLYANRDMMQYILLNQVSEEGDEVDTGTVGADDEGGSSLVDYSLIKDKGDISITYGSAPKKAYEVLVEDSMRYEKYIGSTIDTKVNGKKLTICGFYKDKRGGNSLYVSSKTAFYNYLTKQKDITISPINKAETMAALEDMGLKVTDEYESSKKQYLADIDSEITATVILSLVILIISLVEIYLMLRSSFLSRIKEVGVLRAIGLKKRDIYKMFIGEIIALTTLTALPAMGVMAYILYEVTKIPYIGTQYMMNPVIFLVSFGIVFFFNIIAGLLPVFTTMRKTPAAILARNDVN